MTTKHDKDRELLNELIWKAEQYARRELKTCGTVKPMLFIHGVHGHSQYSGGYFYDANSKDAFLMEARALCIARGADATALVSEAWIRRTPTPGDRDLTPTTWNYTDAQDVVIIKGETRTLRTYQYRPLYWTDDGKIMGLATASSETRGEPTNGRFEGLLSEAIPSKEERQTAKRFLAIPDLTLEEIQMLHEDPEYAMEYLEEVCGRRKGRERGYSMG